MKFGWDEYGFARITGIPEIDAVLGAGDIQDAENCNYPPSGVLAELGVDEKYGTWDAQWANGRVHLASGAILERGQTWRGVWACTRLPDGEREPCNQSCNCCLTDGSRGHCDGQSTARSVWTWHASWGCSSNVHWHPGLDVLPTPAAPVSTRIGRHFVS